MARLTYKSRRVTETIEVTARHSEGDAARFTVRVGSHSYDVGITAADAERLAPGVDAAALVRASFGFLLERESPQSILGRFDLPVIARYFPEYPSEIKRRLTHG